MLALHIWESRKTKLPATIIIATRYGRGSVKLKESSSGPTAGSPSIFTDLLQNAASNEKIKVAVWMEK